MRLWTQRNQTLPLGTVGSFLLKRTFAIHQHEAKTHQHVIGVSGSGKSRYLARWYLTLLKHNLPATLIDPHGDLATLVLSHLVHDGYFEKPGATDNLLYLDVPAAERQGRFLPFNVLKQDYDTHTTARCVLEALRRAWPALDGGAAPNFENIILAGSYVLIHHHLPLVRLHDLLVDKPWRDRLLQTTPDREVVGFFTDRFDRWGKDQPMLLESSLRRIFLLSFSPVLRYSLGQQDNLFDYRRLIGEGKSLLINLAVGDADARRLLGCLLTVSAEQGALSLADQPAEQRRGSHHLLIDEFSEFTAQSEEALSRMLSLTRKYGLFLVMAHQTWSQASARLRGALQNVGIDVAFRLGRSDAEYSAPMFGRVDPTAIKHTVEDKQATERTHPAFYSLPEQWEQWTQAITDLPPQHAFIRTPSGRVKRVKTLPTPDVPVDRSRLREIEDHYLRTYFLQQGEIAREVEKITGYPPRSKRREPLAA